MRHRWLPVLCAALLWTAPALAQSSLVPTDPSLPPLSLVNHQVEVSIDEQVSVTQVTQVFRNASDRALEADFVFPVPKGANVDHFSMWVNGKEEKGELVEADKARQVYTDIVRRSQDPGLLEYVGQDLLKVRVFPVPAHGDQKLSVRFTSVAVADQGLTEYVYPLKSGAKAATALEKFRITAKLKSKHALQSAYSPTHAVTINRHGDHELTASFECEKAVLDKDFHLYYALSDKDVGLTALAHRADAEAPGQVMLLLSPRADLGKAQQAPRDMVFVLDTSGSMSGVKMEQARKALKFCLDNLSTNDRFAVLNFASTVNRYADGLKQVGSHEVAKAKMWVDRLEPTGGTAIDDALKAALDYRHADGERTFTVVFFTDGMPTVGETNADKIVKNVLDRNTTGTRIFTFGVGHDVNAVLLDRLAEQTRAVSTYVAPEEDIEAKVSGLYAKISHPVLTDLKLKTGSNIKLTEVYPTHLPDLFSGGQVVVLGRYQGHGHATVTLTGKVGKEEKEFVYEIDFPGHTGKDRAFVEGLWARRKVGFLLDEIRRNGEKKELVDEVVKLAKKHGITTPYTSYLVVPDGTPPPTVVQTVPMMAPPPVTKGVGLRYLSVPMSSHGYNINGANMPAPGGVPMGSAPANVLRVLERGGFTTNEAIAVPQTHYAPMYANGPAAQPMSPSPVMGDAAWHQGLVVETTPVTVVRPAAAPTPMPSATAQTGKEGVDLALQLKALREQDQLSSSATCEVAGRTCVRLGGAWVDQAYDGKMTTVKVRALKAAYFELLAKHPELKEVFQLGTHVVWVTPSGVALVIDPDAGAETLSADEMAKLFRKK